jgi:hypothetical protein
MSVGTGEVSGRTICAGIHYSVRKIYKYQYKRGRGVVGDM